MIKKFCSRFVCGVLLGLSALAPGFSGSVLAIAMGVYHDLVKIVSDPLREIPKNLDFFIPIAAGIAVSAVLFVRVFRLLVETYPQATFLLFAGLIAGSVPAIVRQCKSHPFRKQYYIGGISAFAIALILSTMGLGGGGMAGDGTGVNFLMLGAGGFVAGAIVLIPGMSISAILIMVGIYGRIMYLAEMLLEGNMSYLLPVFGFLLCALAGLVLVSRGIKTILESFPGFANMCILGFMTGTLLGILVESIYLTDPNSTLPINLFALILGACLALVFVVMGKHIGLGDEKTG